ncbi:MAG: UDP-2,4-diacetamido-2,4,6-trideoxy-beta-L-altropyranose hydrolase [Mariprofundaceae bacterium]|nr:UDP-2,4-diacetamido-2,4,6-trideoxy-beta-L-altropyranose hydrolase [Mariprofundaceae bacterium]
MLDKTCLIRCEYSEKIGFGHLMRCLTLAGELKKYGLAVWVLSSNGRPDMHGRHADSIDRWHVTTTKAGSMEDAAFLAGLAEEVGAELLVLDFYNISESYQLALRHAGRRWLQFDGFADRPLWADWVLSMSPAAEMESYVLRRQNPATHFLLGPKYAILRPDFMAHRGATRSHGDVRRVLLSFGGGDDQGMTLFCLNAIRESGWTGAITAVVGRANPSADRISSWADCYGDGRVHVSVDEPDMAGAMSECDMAVISGGMTTFEAAFMGLPALMVCLADNQRANIKAWRSLGVSVDLGDSSQLTKEDFIYHFLALVRDKNRRAELSRHGMEIVDGQGVERVAEQMLGKMAVANA